MIVEVHESKWDPLDRSPLMVAVLELADARGRSPIGWWTVDLGDGIALTINETASYRQGIDAGWAVITQDGYPIALFNYAGGAVRAPFLETQLLERLHAARRALLG